MMPTLRLYYTDSYTTAFEAELLETIPYNGFLAAILDRTYFYPTSGGQPHDIGALNDCPVVEVVLRETDGTVLHVLDGAARLDGPRVSGQVDWARRFDHMRHHTGQHVLSAAFIVVAQAETISFHLSPDSVTIDLNKTDLSPADLDAAEDLANQVIAEDRPVRAYYPSEQERADLLLRKVPEVEGAFRVVEIKDFDANACGGTHVARTGEIGVIKVLKAERRGETTRVEFCCGARALLDYRQKHALLSQLVADLTTGYDQIPAVLAKLRDENKAMSRELRALKAAALEHEADQLWQTADRAGGYALVAQAFDNRDVAEVRQLAQHLIAHPATIALCAAAGDKAQLIVARSDDLPHDLVPVLKQGLAFWGVERGGGRPSFAQGGGASVSLAQAQAALQACIAAVRAASRE
jgi:alanyl-tRNA synthetase